MTLQLTNLGKVSITVSESNWDIDTSYDRLVVVYNESDGIAYISRQRVPAKNRIPITDRRYWCPMGKVGAQITFDVFTPLSSIAQLPVDYSPDQPYIINGVAYFWTNDTAAGDTLDGKYQSVRLTGPEGDPGKSAYELWLADGGDPNIDESTWLESLKGKDGAPGPAGQSAYEWAKEHAEQLGLPSNVTPTQWYNSLKGKPGDPGTNGKDGIDGQDGTDGQDGASAYELAMRYWNNGLPQPNEADWVASLKGTPGTKGIDGSPGLSAYQIANSFRRANGLEPFANTEEYLASLVGPPGESSIITAVAVRNDKLEVTVKTGNEFKVYQCQLPSTGGGTVPAPQEQVLSLFKGRLSAAIDYANENRNLYFQWIVYDTYVDETTHEEIDVTKIAWHIGNGKIIDANGYVMHDEFSESEVNNE